MKQERFWKKGELLLVNLDERALASGSAWCVVPMARPGLAPPWQEAETAESGVRESDI